MVFQSFCKNLPPARSSKFQAPKKLQIPSTKRPDQTSEVKGQRSEGRRPTTETRAIVFEKALQNSSRVVVLVTCCGWCCAHSRGPLVAALPRCVLCRLMFNKDCAHGGARFPRRLWALEFGIFLELGAWRLELGHHSRRKRKNRATPSARFVCTIRPWTVAKRLVSRSHPEPSNRIAGADSNRYPS